MARKKQIKERQLDWRVVVTGIVALTIAECVAMLLGMNGTMFVIYATIIGAAIGVAIPFRTK